MAAARSAPFTCRATCSASRSAIIHHCSAEAVVPAKVVAFKWQGLVGAGASTSLVRELLTRTMIGLRHTQDHLLLLGRKNALERLAAFLLEMADRSGSTEVLDLAMPRHDIADYLGLTLRDGLAHVRRAQRRWGRSSSNRPAACISSIWTSLRPWRPEGFCRSSIAPALLSLCAGLTPLYKSVRAGGGARNP